MRTSRVGLAAAIALGVGAAVALIRRNARVATGRTVDGGVLIGDVAGYDRLSHLAFGSLFRGIADDVARVAPPDAKVLEVGCGPGLLSIRLAQSHGIDVTGLDLDPAMIERARANAARSANDGASPSFLVGDVASLPFADGSFDVVMSTFSMHHWADRAAGLAEIDRVLRPGGRVLIWDLRPGALPFHPEVDDHRIELGATSLRVAGLSDWHWPGPFTFARRFELARD